MILWKMLIKVENKDENVRKRETEFFGHIMSRVALKNIVMIRKISGRVGGGRQGEITLGGLCSAILRSERP